MQPPFKLRSWSKPLLVAHNTWLDISCCGSVIIISNVLSGQKREHVRDKNLQCLGKLKFCFGTVCFAYKNNNRLTLTLQWTSLL